MKLYKSEKNIIVNFENKFYDLQGLDWDLFINDDNLYSKARSLVSKSNKISDRLFAKIDPPIESQELWASGVTYFISKKENVYNYEEKEILTDKDYFIENILSNSLFEKEKIIISKRATE